MKTVAYLFLFFSLIAVVPQSFAEDSAKEPKLIAVKFHADWCGSCRKMGPVFEDLRNKFDGKPVLFVELDKTNVSTVNHAGLLASAMGLKDIYAASPEARFQASSSALDGR